MARYTYSWRQLAAVGAIVALGACDQMAPTHHVASNPPPNPPGHDAVWYHVRFATGGAAIDADGQKVIDGLVVSMRSDPAEVATIIGKADTIGSPDENMHLSHRRADAVRDALLYNGQVAADHVKTHWTGEQRQDVATADDVSQAGNRVVDIAVNWPKN